MACSAGGFRLAASATASIVPTTWVMLATDTIHPPACARTLIVSLALLPTPLRVGIIVGSILLLVLFHGLVLRGFDRLGGTTPQDYLGPD